MDIKINVSSVLFTLLIVLFFNNCGKDCVNTTYRFSIDESINPDKALIYVGDTIFLNVNANTTLKDLSSGVSIDYSKAQNLGNVVSLLKFLPANKSQGAIGDFNLIVQKGSKVNSIDPTTNQEVLFNQEDNFYKFKMAIIPKDTGRYVLTISNAANVYRKNDCTKAGFEISFNMTDQHFNLLKLWRPDLTLDEINKSKVYYFQVN